MGEASAYVTDVLVQAEYFLDHQHDRRAPRTVGRGKVGIDTAVSDGQLKTAVAQSNGGRLPAEAMRQSAITALYSGPAAGVVGATARPA